jgi:hypothetical protein
MYFCVLLCGNVSWLQLDHPFPYYWYDTQDSFIFLCLSLTYLLLCFLSDLLPGVIDPRLMTMVVLRVACPPATPPNRHAPRHSCSSGFPGHPGRHASLRGPHSYCVRRVVDGCACGNVNIYNDFIVMSWVFVMELVSTVRKFVTSSQITSDGTKPLKIMIKLRGWSRTTNMLITYDHSSYAYEEPMTKANWRHER